MDTTTNTFLWNYYVTMLREPIIIINFILCWKDVKLLQSKYLHNRSFTKVNKLKLIWDNVKNRKSYNNLIKQISGSYP